MGLFSNLFANSLQGAIGRALLDGRFPAAAAGPAGGGPSPAPDVRPRARAGLLDPLEAAFDPRRMALIQATLAGDHGAISRMTEPLRRQRLARRAAQRDELADQHGIDAATWFPAGPPAGQADDWEIGQPLSPLAPSLGDHEAIDVAAGPVRFQPFGRGHQALAAAMADPASQPMAAAFQPASLAQFGSQDRPGRVTGRARAGADVSVSSGPRAAPAPQSPPPSGGRFPWIPILEKPLPSPSQPLPYGGPSGWLADHRETSGRGARTISSGVDDPGGVSVGRYQIERRMWPRFLQSDLGAPWRREFQGLNQDEPEFRQAWNRVIDREGDRFDKAQYRYLHRVNYLPYGAAAARRANFDLAAAHPILQEVVWSGANNMGGGGVNPARLATAVQRADQRFRRDDPRHQEAVIDAFYDEWADRWRAIETDQRDEGRYGEAGTSRNIWSRQLPEERARAIGAYRKAVGQH
ncbi:hypothetical protein [Sphingosinicella terrae]|uniref:VgrG-related protein n=1 Tax=Sphingosinicella terrae TaxID=2172047 RepID=UPI000E0D5352|nr:hypothetical protein [Sphingosinicella terrae]